MNYSLINYTIFIARKTSHVCFTKPRFLNKIKTEKVKTKTWIKKGINHLQKQQTIRNFRYSKNVFRMFSCFLLQSVFIRTSKITQVVSCVGGGHRIKLVICKVLVFRKFHFYEPFYFYVNYFIWFCFCRNKQRGWILVQMEWQTSELQEIDYSFWKLD